MGTLLRAFYDTYSDVFEKYSDHRSDDWALMGSPWQIIGICTCYMYFVQNLGPKLMKNRSAFDIDRLINIYNLIQIGLNCYTIYYAHGLGYGSKHSWYCEPILYTDTPYAVKVLSGVWLYHVLKVTDLLDTVFFVLRKKNKQITFLHVYHHTIMVVMTWIVTKFLPGGHGIFLGYVNCYVHVIMYTYYFVTSMWPEYKKNIWWKKHITQVQMAQFVLIGLHSLPVFIDKDCEYPRVMGLVLLTQNVFMFILFYDFYRKAYGKKKINKT